jgi:hypothetical protein
VKGSDFVKGLPEKPGQDREDKILAAVVGGDAVVCFTPLVITGGDHTLRIDVAMDAVKIGEAGDAVRVAASVITQQKIADSLGCLLPTAKICDLIWNHVRGGGGVVLTPQTQTPDSQMAYTSRFVKHDAAIEKQREGRCGLLWPVGKVFAVSNKASGGKVANYGWHVQKGSKYAGVTDGVIVLQPLATAHVATFTDYSQLCGGFVKRMCVLDGEEEDLAELLADPEIAPLISSEGPLDAFMYREAPSPPSSKNGAPDAWRSPLKKGMQGSDVLAMQELLISHGLSLDPYGADGDFGSLTDKRVRDFQRARGLMVDGVVGEQTHSALLDGDTIPGPPPESDSEDPLVDDFIQAKNFTNTTRKTIKHIVLHSTESKPDSARAVARWFGGTSAPRASAHFIIDRDECIQCVKVPAVAWAAPGCNSTGIQLEHCGFAMKSKWLEEEESTLRRSARLVASLCKEWDIPVEFVNEAGLKAGKPGITTHYRVSIAFRKSDHVDPGGPEDRNWPISEYLEMVKKEM